MKTQPLKISRRKILFSFGVAGLVYVLLCVLLSSTLPGASKVTVTLETDHPDTFQLFYWDGLRKIEFQEKFSVRSREVKETEKKKVIFRLNDTPVKKLRLDIGEKGGVVKLYLIAVKSHLAKSKVLTPADIYRVFKPGNDGTTLRQYKDYIEVSSVTDDPFIVSTQPLLKANVFLLYGIPFLMSGIVFLLLSRFDARSFPSFADIAMKRPSSGVNVDALDGLRGIAAIMVVADHTWGRCTGMGEGGVWIFMVLSGFLLAQPFARQPAQILSRAYMTHFFLRRIKRIVPIYYFYIILVYVLTKRFDIALRHFVFVEGAGHLWVVPQEMFFYLLTPLIIFMNFLLHRWSNRLVPVTLALLVFLANHMLDKQILSFYGMFNQSLSFYIGMFLSGVFSSYVYHEYSISTGLQDKWREQGRTIFSLTGTALLLFFLLASTGRLWGGTIIYSQVYYQWFGVAAAGLLFSIMATKNTFLTRLLSVLPLRAIGLVSLSLYLFHPLVLQILRSGVFHYTGHALSGFPLFIVTLVMSYGVACFLYTYIERPFSR